jgi:hypothetical protein
MHTPIGARHRSGSGNAITDLGHRSLLPFVMPVATASTPFASTALVQGCFLCRSYIEALLCVWRFNFHAVRQRVRCSCSIWLSALRQPARQSAAPKCHMPSPSWPRVLWRSAHRISGSHVHQHQAKSLEINTRERRHASDKHQYPSAFRRALIRHITCAAPNWAFNWTSTCCARCCQLTGALGLSFIPFIAIRKASKVSVWPSHLAPRG